MKRLCSLLLALLLCVALIVPASAAGKSEFDRLGLSVMQETPDELPLTYVVYDPDDPSDHVVKEGRLVVGECTVKPASKTDYVDITLTVYAYLQYHYDFETETFYNSTSWNNSVCDYYTGRRFKFGDLTGDERRDITTTVRFNGRDYTVSCSKANEWTQSEWVYDRDEYTSDVVCTSTMTFTVPENYNGLVYGLYKNTSPATSEIDVFFRFGHTANKEMPRDGLVLSVYEQGQDEPLGYSIGNHGTEDVSGYYALLSYWPITQYYPANEMKPYESEYFYGQILPLNVDLAPGETLEGDCWAIAAGWSTMTHKWIKFDDKAERDAFFRASALELSNGVYAVDMGSEGIQWMKDTFGITIYSGKYWG